MRRLSLMDRLANLLPRLTSLQRQERGELAEARYTPITVRPYSMPSVSPPVLPDREEVARIVRDAMDMVSDESPDIRRGRAAEKAADAILALFPKAPSTPAGDAAMAEGWVLVPKQATEAMVDAARGLCMYFNAMSGNRNWTLGLHADSGGYGEGYAHLLTERERAMSHFPKAHQADLIYRAMIAAAPPTQGETR